MLRLRRSCPTLGWRLLLQRRHAGKSGHAQRTFCSSPDSIEERWEADEKEGVWGLNEAEAYQSVPLLALLC
jgi:hypothetical protein